MSVSGLPRPQLERERLIFSHDNPSSLYEPYLQVISKPGLAELRLVCIDNYCGDSETGIGAEVGVDLNAEQVAELHAGLGEWLESRKGP
jgi:hypothetical protein